MVQIYDIMPIFNGFLGIFMPLILIYVGMNMAFYAVAKLLDLGR